MRQANAVLEQLSSSPCPFGPFGTVVINHTDTSGLGEVVCIGLSARDTEGNPTLHGTADWVTPSDVADVEPNR